MTPPTLRIVGKSASINVRKVLWTCAELELPFDHVETDPQLLAENPNRLVPMLEDGDLRLRRGIRQYIANGHVVQPERRCPHLK